MTAAERPAHEFYASAFDTAEELARAAELDGLDAELPMLRLRLHKALRDQALDIDLVVKLGHLLVRAATVRYRISPRRSADLATAVTQIFDALAGDVLPPEE